MTKNELYKLIDSYVEQSPILEDKIRSIIKQELSNLINGYSGESSNMPLKETRIPTNKKQLLTQTPSLKTSRPPIDKSKYFEGDFEKIGLKESSPKQIVVPGTGGMVTIDAEEVEEYMEDEDGPAPSVMDNINKGKSTGIPFMDKILTTDYSNYSKRLADKQKGKGK